MAKSAFRREIESAIQQRHSKIHPFSEAWVSGGLTKQLLGEWVKQHFHYVSHFPWWCGRVYADAEDQETRAFLVENVMEEEGFAEEGGFPAAKHTDLLLDFGEACGMPRKEIEDAQLNGELLPETLGLQSWCYRQSHKPTYEAIAALVVGLESQVPQIYKRTTPPLIEKYGFTEDEIVFFRLHIVADTEHGERGFQTLERLADTDAMKATAIRIVDEATGMRRLYLDGLYNKFLAPRQEAAE
jgi:pyrroloquinoline-quinone synthase